MSDPRNGNRRALHDHGSPSGDQVAFQYVITVTASGAFNIQGPIDNKEYTLALLENVADAVRSHHARKELNLTVPARDVALPKRIA